MTKLKPYTKYKDSGIDWLGEIPEDWDLVKNKAIFKEKKNIVGKKSSEYTLLSLTLKGIIDRDMDNPQGKFPESFDTYKIVEENDLVFCLFDIAETPRTVGVVPHTGMITGAYTTFSVQKSVLPEYIYYYYVSLDNNKALGSQYSGLRNTINVNRFLNLQSPKPSINVQRNIVDYLNTKSKEIDKYVKKLKKEIALLKEHRQKIISQAVTCGLDENGKLRKKPEWNDGDPAPNGWKDSGVNNIKHIPEIWSDIKLRSIFKAVSIKNHPDLPLLSVVREKGVIIRDIEDFETNHNFIPTDLSNYKVVRKGQFAMNKMKAWQGSYGISEYEGIVSPAYYIFDVMRNDIDLKFLHIALRSRVYVNQFGRASQGVRPGQWDLSIPQMKDIQFFYPNLKEQNRIVEYINSKVEHIRVEEQQIEKQINFVKEYKQSLISKVVTGKIDVRSINNNLSED